MEQKQKIALITGGSRGLGKDMALQLAAKGSDVILTYNSKKAEAEAVVAEIEAMGRKAVALQLNVSEIASFYGFMQQVTLALQEKWNTDKFDFLVNNAGIGATVPFAQVTEANFDEMLNVHFKGVFF